MFLCNSNHMVTVNHIVEKHYYDADHLKNKVNIFMADHHNKRYSQSNPSFPGFLDIHTTLEAVTFLLSRRVNFICNFQLLLV